MLAMSANVWIVSVSFVRLLCGCSVGGYCCDKELLVGYANVPKVKRKIRNNQLYRDRGKGWDVTYKI